MRSADLVASVRRRIAGAHFITKLYVVFVATVVVLSAALGSLYFSLSREEIEDVLRDQVRSGLDQIRASVEYRVTLAHRLADFAYLNATLQGLLFTEHYDDVIAWAKAMEQLLAFLAPLAEIIPDAEELAIYVVNPVIPELRGTIRRLENATGESWYAAHDQQFDLTVWRWTEVRQFAAGPPAGVHTERRMSLLRNLRNLSQSSHPANYLGVLKVDFPGDRLFGPVIQAREGADMWAELSDAGGTLMAGGLNGAAHAPAGGPAAGERTIHLDGRQYLVVWDTVDPPGWRLSYFVARDRYLALSRRLRFVGVAVSLSVAAVLAVLLRFVAASFSRRIRVLSAAVGEIRAGRYDLRLPPMGSDEVGVLGDGVRDLSTRLKQLIEDDLTNRLLHREYELSSLQAQLNPHFLYNTLGAIGWYGRRHGAPELVELAQSLAAFYKHVLSRGRSVVSVADEFAHIRSYMAIQQIRYRDRVRISYRCDEQAHGLETPKLVLQPLVENSILHGLEDGRRRVHITVEATVDGESLLLRVSDDGAGFAVERRAARPEEEAAAEGAGDAASFGGGIRNADRRIRLRYGDRYGVTIDSAPGEGTTVMLRLPARPYVE